MPDFELEMALGGLVAGVDEAGRGPLCGPVVAAAVVFPGGCPAEIALLIDDSKRLSPRRRERAHSALLGAMEAGAAWIGIGAASATEIGRLNILGATHLAMERALRRLPGAPDAVLVDGNRAPRLPWRTECVVGGDARSLSIAAASIVAKQVRDRGMSRLGARWPGYGLEIHAGYPTASHREALQRLGATPHHRRGFAPVDAALAGRRTATARAPGVPAAAATGRTA